MFNGGIRGKRANDNQGTISPQSKFVQSKEPQPYISGYTISGTDDTALDPAGGQTVLVNGTGFATGISATVAGTQIGSVTLVSPTQISFTSPAKAGGSYSLVVYNSTGGAAILVPGLTYSSVPTFTTSAGSIGSYYETTAINTSVTATSDSSITYSLSSGSLPSGATFYGNGVITGTSPVDSSSTTYTFDITATDAELQDVTRTFTLTINTDVVSWVSPADGTNYSLIGNQAMSNVTLSATSAAGYNVSYSANALPTGVTLSGNTISGTPTVAETTSTLLTATAATTNRTATRTVSWTVTVGDTYWKNVSLLLSGSTPTTTFINDASLNNNQLTIAGDTKPNNFNPYQSGYYSYYFDGSSYLQTNTTSTYYIPALGSGSWTYEFWIMPTVASQTTFIDMRPGSNGYYVTFFISSGTMTIFVNSSTVINGSSLPLNVWTHIALVKNGSTLTLYTNGQSSGSVSDTNTYLASYVTMGTNPFSLGSNNYTGYFSNIRIVKGTAVYTSAFTPPTSPLTAVSGTVLLLGNMNKFADASLLNTSLALTGTLKISSAHPFATPTTVAYNTLYSAYFDGTGDYLSLSGTMSAIGTNDFTIEMWLRVTTSGTYNVLDFTPAGSNGAYINFYLSSMTPALYVNSANRITGGAALNINQWYHVAISRVSGNTRMFIDGTQSGSTWTDSTSYLSPANRPVLCTSGNNIGANYMPGLVSNLRIINGTGLYSGNFTPPTTSLTAVANTMLLTCQDSTLKDNSTNAFAITSYGQAQPIALSPFTMTTSNTTVTSLGSAYLDGTGDYLDMFTSNNGLQIKSNNFTIEGWFYPTVAANYNEFFSFDNVSGSGFSAIRCRMNSSRQIELYMSTDGSGWSSSGTSTGVLTLNSWNHIAVVRNGSGTGNIVVYINGVSAGLTLTFSGSGYTASSLRYNIGSVWSSGASTEFWQGHISDFRVVNGSAIYTANFLPPQAPLTPVTNTSLLTCQYNGGANNNGFVDQSSFNNIVTRTGNATQGTFSPYSQTGWSNYFDGSGDYLSMSDNAAFQMGTGDFTIECWVCPTVLSATDSRLWSYQAAGSATVMNVYLLASGSSSVFSAELRSSNGTGNVQTNGTTSAKVGTWYHVAFVRYSGTTKLFVNGVQEGSTQTTQTQNIASGTPAIGYYPAGSSNYFTGYISNFRILKGTALYTSAFTPSTTPLTAIANTQLLTCQSNRIIDNSPNNFTVTKAGDVSVQAYSPFGGVTNVPTSYSNYFDGTGDQIQFNVSTTPFAFGTGDFTMECWVYMNDATTTKYLIMLGAITGANPLLYFRNGPYNFYFYYSSGYHGNTTSTISANTWYHLAVSRTSGTLQIFLNGVSEYSATDNTNFTCGTGYPYISGNAAAGNIMNGYISNVRIVKGTGLYTSNFTPSTSPLTTTSQGATASQVSLLTCQSSTLVDNSLNYFTPTVTGDTKPRPFNPFGSTNTTGVSYTPALNGGSVYFDGTGDYLTLSASPNFTFGTSNFTIEGWAYMTGINGTANGIFQQGTSFPINSTTNTVAFATVSSSQVWQIYANGTNTNSTVTWSLNTWYHFAVVRNSTTTTLYINGVAVITVTGDSTNYTGTYFGIGAIYSTSYSQQGYISDVRVVKGTALYTSNFYPGSAPATPTTTIGSTTYSSTLLLSGTSGGIIDYHSSNNLETVGNTQLASEDPYAGSYYSNLFDGSSSYFTATSGVALPIGTENFTVEMWINKSNAWNAANQVILISGTSGSLQLWVDSSVPSIKVSFNSGSTPLSYSTSSLSLNKWYHLAITRSGNNFTMYINGSSVATGTDSGSFATPTSFIIGNYTSGTSNIWNGYISNLRIVRGTAIVPAAGGPTAPLTAVSGTSLLTCQSNKFVDNSSNALALTVNGTLKVKSMNPFQQNTGKSLYFDGSGDYLYSAVNNPAYSFGTGDFTIEFWLYLTAQGTYNLYDARSSSNTGGPAFYTQSGQIKYNYGGADLITGATLVASQWYHIAVARSGSSTKLFVNGTQSGSTYTDSTNYVSYSPFFGAYSGALGSNNFNGYMTDLRITKGVARYTSTFTPPTDPLQNK